VMNNKSIVCVWLTEGRPSFLGVHFAISTPLPCQPQLAKP
jgi:hypothetical protein